MPRQPVRADLIPKRGRQFSLGSNGSLPEVRDVKPLPVRDDWHYDAYVYAKAVPPVRYVLRAKADLLSRCLIRAERRVPNSDEWAPTEDARALRVARAFVDENGSQGELLRQACAHAEKAGVAWLYGDPVKDPRGRIKKFIWSFKSMSELKVERRGDVRIQSWGRGVDEHKAPPDGIAERCLFYPDDEFSDRPTSPVFSILPQMKQWVLAEQVIDAICRSKLPAGLMFIPDEVSFGPTVESDNPGNPAEGVDEFEAEFHEHTGRAATDQTSATRLNPLFMRGPAMITKGDKAVPMIQAMGLVDISRDLDGYLSTIRDELVQIMAQGLDCPPETLMGKGGLNHWSGWNIDSDFISKNVVPLGTRILELVTVKYYRPMLMLTGMSAEDAEWFHLALDPAPITADPDKSAVATEAWQQIRLSDSAWVSYLGLDESEMPDEEELARRSLERIMFSQPTTTPNVMRYLYPNVDFGDTFDGWTVGQSVPGGANLPSASMPSSKGMPAPRGPLLSLSSSLLKALVVAADRDMVHALESAGRQLIGKVNGSDTTGKLRRAPKTEVLTVAGTSVARQAGFTGSDLFAGAFDDLGQRVTDWLTADMSERGVDPGEARQRAQAAANELVSQLQLCGASALDRPLRVGPNGARVPDEVVLSALAAGDLLTINATSA